MSIPETPNGLTPDFRSLFEAVTVPLLVIAPPEWIVVGANEARLRLNGATLDEQLGRRLFDLFPDDPDDIHADGVRNLTASLERVLVTKAADTMPVQRYAVRDPAGRFEERWWSPVNSPVLGDGGEVAFILHQVLEVTDAVRLRGEADAQALLARDRQDMIVRLRAAETELRASEEFNRRVLASSADCIKVLDLEGRVEFMSEGGRGVMEVEDFSAVEGASWPTFWEGEERGKALDALTEARAGGTARFQGFAKTMKGSPRWWDVIVTPMGGVDGRPDKLLSVSRDVSAAKRAETRALTIVELSNLIRDIEDPADLAYAAAELLGRTLQVSRAGYGTIDKAAETITIDRDWNAPGIRSIAGTLQFRDYGSYIEDLKQGRTAVVEDANRDPRTAATADALKSLGAWSFVNMPVTEQGDFVALLFLNHQAPRIWPADELELVRDVAERIRVATERRRAEAELERSEARLRAVLDAVPVGLIFADAPSGRITGGNEQAERIFGHPVLPSADISHYREWTSFHPDGRPVDAEEYPLSRAIRGEVERPELEVLYQRGDGREAFVRLIASAIRDDEGRITGGVVASLDIDREKRAEAELRALNENLEREVEARTAELDRVWRNSRDLLVVIGADGIFRAVNPAWTAILGHEPSEVIGRSFLDFIWPEDATMTQEGLDSAASARDLTSFENRYTRKDGSPRWISWSTAVEGDIVYAYGRDVTAEKEQAEALAEAQEALRQAQKMEAVGQLTGGIAHDFNNLLTGVIGSLDMMERQIARGDTSKVERYAKTAMTSANRAAALTHRLLAFSRRQPLDPKPVNANRLVTGMEELIRRTIGEAIALEVVTAGGLWQTLCDPHQLESAILNLAINARDAMPDGGKLTVETCNAHLDTAYAARERDVRPGQYVCVCVTDTGTGMSKDTIAKAFEPFFTTKPIGQGTGLGLSMIYGFARQSEGYARIYSETGEGTTIKLYLPRYYGEAEDAEHVAMEVDEEHRAETGEVVLVVEDEAAVRNLVIDVLGDLGYRTLEAADGPTGLRVLQSDARVDLLVTDIGLPGLNGRQVADAARQLRPGLKVLFMTGYAENATIANGFLEPGMEMITKPFAVDALATRIRDMVER